jgi:hypothetical protein
MIAAVVLTSAFAIRKHPATTRKPPAVLASSTNPQLRRAGGVGYSFGRTLQASQARLLETYGKLPLSFEINQGQTDARVKFLSHGHGYSLFLTASEAVLTLRKNTQQSKAGSGQAARRLPTRDAWLLPATFRAGRAGQHAPRTIDAVLRMRLVSANVKAKVTGLDELLGKSNYLIGNDPKKWRTNVPNYAKVKYANVYPGIDLVYHGSQGQLEYDLQVAPGADPRKIALRFAGADSVNVDAKGELILHTAGGEIRSHPPIIYQEVNGRRKIIAGSYMRMNPQQVGFSVAAYDPARPLIIDPVVSYLTFIYGNGDDIGYSIAVDNNGNAYVTGSTSSINFPVTIGPFQYHYPL